MDKAREHIPVGVRADIPGSSSMARSYRNYVSTARHEAGDHLLDAAHIEIPAHLNNKVILFDMVMMIPFGFFVRNLEKCFFRAERTYA